MGCEFKTQVKLDYIQDFEMMFEAKGWTHAISETYRKVKNCQQWMEK